MPLLGKAAMLLCFDVVADARPDHDAWHTHEHLPERLAIPGFLRGTRWVATRGQPGYVVLYEVESLATLGSPAYLERLNHPSAWTTRVMPSYRGMTRGFCTVTGSFGYGMGQAGRLLRFKPRAGDEAATRESLLAMLRALPGQPGMSGAHFLEGAATPAMTTEQRIRGQDAAVDWALFLTAYDAEALAAIPLPHAIEAPPSPVHDASYRVAHSLAATELHGGPAG